ncbi:MAG: endopeptidase La [Cytophagales bacterium]|nr:endopeptidase La [Cytophagales bacterium]
MRHNKNPYENLVLAEMADDDTVEMIPLLSPDEDEDFSTFKVPEQLPILPVKNTVLFPGVVIPITVGRQKSIRLVKRAYKGTRVVGVIAQANNSKEEPAYDDLHRIGTVAHIIKMLVLPDGNTTIIIQGKRRFEMLEPVQQDPYLTAKVNLLPENFPSNTSKEVKAMVKSLKEAAGKILNLRPEIPREAQIAIENIESPSFLTNFLASNLDAEVSDKQKILELNDGMQRAELLLQYMQKDIQLLELKHEIQSKVHSDLDQQQRDYFLRQQIKVLQDELGYDSTEKEIEELRLRGAKKSWPPAVAKHFDKELDKLTRINPQAAEYPVAMNYVELLVDLPWGEYTQDSFDLVKARKILDADHYGLEKIKDRIVEYLAVLKLTQSLRGPILCLYGPPGVGKTSLGRSIAKALGRHYIRMSLGGVHDEAEIRGHRKTYVGAMPGKVMQNIRKAKSSNPVFILDEIDKVGADFRGDPSSALLEVLDPEQNSTFMDNYLEVEFDLSKVLFIATANSLETIQPALRDRMEIIELTGYTLEEKLQIAKKHLIPKQRKEHGLTTKDISFDDKALVKIIDDYTRESGVRTLERQIGTVMRKIAKSVAIGEEYDKKITPAYVVKALGAEIFDKEIYQDNSVAGVVTGLAWTQVGGEILFVESSLSRGRGRLTLSGQLGDVMKESATAALSYLRAHTAQLGIDHRVFDQFDLHVHVPAGAVPKDGPSAGITMFTSLASVYTQRKVREKLAMTGEITLRGRVLPVGGIKEKILAAKRAGIEQIVMSEKNRRDVEEINPRYIQGLQIHYVNNVEEVLQHALLPEKVSNPIDLAIRELPEKEPANGAVMAFQ